MRLISLELENWGPYRGTQVLDMDTSPSAPVILVEGENERGKTSLFFGLRYALYGSIRDHDDKEIDVSELANWDARDEGEPFWFGPILRFQHDDDQLELIRKHKGVLTRHLDGPKVQILESRTQLRVVGGDPFPEKDIDHRIQRILHPDISSFFLFDGETLTRVERLLKNEDAGSVFVRESIERALGIPALRLLRGDVDDLAEEAGAEVRKAARAARVSQEATERLGRAEDALERAERDIESLREMQTVAKKSLEEANAQLSEVDSIKDAFYQRKSLADQLAEIEADLQFTEDAIRQLLNGTWWLPLGATLRQEADKAIDAVAEVAERAQTTLILRNQLETVRRQIADPTCLTCKQPMPQDALRELNETASELERRLADDQPPEALDELRLREARLRKFLSAEGLTTQLAEYESDLKRFRLRMIDIRGKMDRLTEVIQDNNMDIAALDSQANDALESLGRIDFLLAQAQTDRSDAMMARQDATAEIARLTGETGLAASAEMEVLKTLGGYLDEAIGAFRNEMRIQIQEEASNIFRQLTTEPEYAGLRINGNYYLTIIDANDRVVSRRSAGANQVVTMALIGALSRCAVEEGPIVMDTPFARLDTGHRSRILRWSAALGTQVVLFVQSGEFDRSRDLQHLDGRVGRSYVLRRVGTNATRIEGISHE